nr:MAG TPA: hypothetical protein [Caudoviricetes sp.]
MRTPFGAAGSCGTISLSGSPRHTSAVAKASHITV